MHVAQHAWIQGAWKTSAPARDVEVALVLVFGARALLTNDWLADVQTSFPGAIVVGCSTAGEILGTGVYDDSVVVTAIRFRTTRVRAATREVVGAASSCAVGASLARELLGDDLVHVLVFSDGTTVNGSDLVRGFASVLPEGVALTGGLAADGAAFERTAVVANGRSCERCVTAVGLYGRELRVGFGSLGGWDPFGPERRVTRSAGNVLYELDGESALSLYERFLGDHAARLPSSALLFPLSVRVANGSQVVRTVLGIDRVAQTMTFAGDLPEGSYARLMKANFDRLIDGAHGAAMATHEHAGRLPAGLAILISCVGRKLVLGQRVEEEIEGVREVLGTQTPLAGFYSYGEICPVRPAASCELHNQTMTITTLSEN